MGRVHDKDVEKFEPPVPEPAKEPVGRVEVDARGRNVWRWARDVIDSTSVLLKRLENKDLALEPTQKVPVVRGTDPASKNAAAPKGAAAQKGKKSAEEPVASDKAVKHPALQRERRGDGGFDPYNSR
jgi:hypothetical protein